MSGNKIRVPFVYDDGGREAAGFKGKEGDCLVRAIAIATKRPYAQVYEWVNNLCFTDKCKHRPKCYAHSGVMLRHVFQPLIKQSWRYYEMLHAGTMADLPDGRLIVRVKNEGKDDYHSMAVVNGVVHDAYDWQKCGFEILGFFKKKRRKSRCRKRARH